MSAPSYFTHLLAVSLLVRDTYLSTQSGFVLDEEPQIVRILDGKLWIHSSHVMAVQVLITPVSAVTVDFVVGCLVNKRSVLAVGTGGRAFPEEGADEHLPGIFGFVS